MRFKRSHCRRLLVLFLSVVFSFSCSCASAAQFNLLGSTVEGQNLLSGRDCGNVRMMRGCIHLICVFVDDSEGYWTDWEVDEMYRGIWKDTAYLENLAAQYGVFLKFTSSYDRLSVPADQESRWLDYLLETRYNNPAHDLTAVEAYFEQVFGVNEAPFLFFFNKEGRCYCYMATYSGGIQPEYAVYYPSTMSWDRSIAHELYHLFGATDLYYPDRVRDVANRYFPDSSMLIGGREMDELTAYLIGWTDGLGYDSFCFLNDIS